jgi:hypothetical protein
MKCSNHPKTDAVSTCAECGKPLCAECAIEVGGAPYCRESLEKLVRRATPHRHGRLTKLVAALLSIVPGAGHMFLGLVGKGFALMGLLFLSVFLVILYSDSTGMYWMSAYLIPTLSVLFLCYAVFDAMAIADALRGGETGKGAQADAVMKAIWEKVLLNRKTLAWILLVAGAVGVLNIFSAPLRELSLRYLSFEVPIAALILPVALVVFGIVLLRRGRKGRDAA